MESEIGTLRKTRDDALLKADKNDAALTGALGALAERMETLATKLTLPKAGLSDSESLEQHVERRDDLVVMPGQIGPRLGRARATGTVAIRWRRT